MKSPHVTTELSKEAWQRTEWLDGNSTARRPARCLEPGSDIPATSQAWEDSGGVEEKPPRGRRTDPFRWEDATGALPGAGQASDAAQPDRSGGNLKGEVLVVLADQTLSKQKHR